MPELTRNTVTYNGATNAFTDDQAEPRPVAGKQWTRCITTRGPAVNVHDKITSPCSMAMAHRPREVRVMMQPIRLR